MKKILTLATIAAASIAVAAVTSENIVGYQTLDKTDNQYVSVGFGFSQVGDASTFKLSDITPITSTYMSDWLQVLNTTAAKVTAAYTYYGASDGATVGEDDGWYDRDDAPAGETEFPVGTAFLGNFAAKDMKFSQAGSVLVGATALDYTGSQYVMMGNPLPMAMTLGDIVPSSSTYMSDWLQVLNTTAAKVTAAYTYYGASDGAIIGEDDGWYDRDDESADDVVINPGDAWLGNFAAKDMVLVFPSVVE